MDLIERTLPPLSFSWGSAVAAQMAASLGKIAETDLHSENALRIATALDVPLARAWALAGRAHLQLALGDAAGAVELLDQVARITHELSLREPGFFLWHGDYLEALVTCGRHADALTVLADLQSLAMTTGRKWATGIVLRTEGAMAGSCGDADVKFAASVQLFFSLKMPFEVARTNLAWATANPKQYQRMRLAKEEFRRMGARLWVERSFIQRRASDVADGADGADGADLVLSTPAPSIFAVLTSAESRVALAISAGKTNREASEELHVSVRTVEFHLGSIYRKTNVKNRSALIASLR